MKRRRSHRRLRRRYGRAFPLIAVALAKLGMLERAERALEPMGRLAGAGWRRMTGKKKRKS